MGWLLQTSVCVRAILFGVLLAEPLAFGQAAAVGQPQSVVDVLHQLSDKADVIFMGQVLTIRRPNDGVVEVEFRVDQALRGCTAGTPYVLHEWMGLWAGGVPRYRVGQRLLMLLHAPSAAGLSSPVGGLDGAIPIRQGKAATVLAGAATPAQPPYVDLRWLGAKLPRAISYRSDSKHTERPGDVPVPFVAPQQTMRVATAGSIANATVIAPMIGNANAEGSVPAQQASVDAVIGMLTSWQKAQHVAP